MDHHFEQKVDQRAAACRCDRGPGPSVRQHRVTLETQFRLQNFQLSVRAGFCVDSPLQSLCDCHVTRLRIKQQSRERCAISAAPDATLQVSNKQIRFHKQNGRCNYKTHMNNFGCFFVWSSVGPADERFERSISTWKAARWRVEYNAHVTLIKTQHNPHYIFMQTWPE